MANIPEGFIYQEEDIVLEKPSNLLPEGFVYQENEAPIVSEDEKSMIPEFLQELGKNWEERTRLVEESERDYEAGKIGLAQYTTQVAGKGVAGRVLDLGGAAVSGAIDGVSFLIPDTIEEPIINTIKEGWDFVLNTEKGQEASKAVSEGIEAYNVWKQANPQDAKTFESVVNIGLVFAPVKTKKEASPVPSFERTGQKILRKGKTQKKTTSMGDIQDMLYPDITPEMAKRTTEKGILRRAVYKPTTRDFAIFNDVRKVPGIKPNRSPFFNLDRIQKEAIRESKKLEKALEKSKIIFPHLETKGRLTSAVNDLVSTNTFIAGDKQVARTIKLNLDKALEIVSKHPSTPHGLLKARREFDKVLQSQMPKVFDAKAQTIATESSKVFRNTLNSMIDEKVPSAFVKKSLNRQSNLFTARDMLAPVASKATRTGLGRLYQNLQRTLIGPKMDLNRVIAILGAGSAFQAASIAPVLAGYAGGIALGAGVYGTIRALGSPKAKEAVGTLIKYTDKAIQTSTNPKMIKQLRLDRAFLQDLVEIAAEENNIKEN